LQKELHIWNQHFISYKMVPISITFEKVVEVLYCGHLITVVKKTNIKTSVLYQLRRPTKSEQIVELLRHFYFRLKSRKVESKNDLKYRVVSYRLLDDDVVIKNVSKSRSFKITGLIIFLNGFIRNFQIMRSFLLS